MNNKQTLALIHDAASDYSKSYYQTHKDWKRDYNKKYYREHKQYWKNYYSGDSGVKKALGDMTAIATTGGAAIDAKKLQYSTLREAQKLGNLGRKATALVKPGYTSEDATRETANTVRNLAAGGLADGMRIAAKSVAGILKTTGKLMISDTSVANKIGGLAGAKKAVGSVLKKFGSLAAKTISDFANSFGSDPFNRG